MPYILIILFFILVICLVVWPVQWAARMMKARNTGFWLCLLALIAATILHGLGLLAPVAGSIVAFLLSAAGFAAILGTSYLRGICDEYVAADDLFGAEYTQSRPLRELVIHHTCSCPDFGAFRVVKKTDAMEIMKTAMGSRGTNRSDAKSSKTETSNHAKQKTKTNKTGSRIL